MNYRHAYHAGGVADVFKHVVMIALLQRLRQKESAFIILDTHAGTGLYDLGGGESGKTGEFRGGIERLRGFRFASPVLNEYLAAVESVNQGDSLRFYPGSPLLAAAALRQQDRSIACELHEQDYPSLRRTLKPYANAAAHHRDGYESMRAFLPPAEKRGLVLIDPPFETATELADAGAALIKAHARFANGIYALWYPIKERPALWRFQEDMIASGIRNQIAIEFLTQDERDSRLLNGSGMLIINPPYRLQDDLKPALEELRAILAPAGKVTIAMLADE